MPKRVKPIYELEHGVQVLREFPLTGLNRYVRLRIRPHWLFPDTKAKGNAQLVRKSRAVMSVKLGRPLLRSEMVHHINEDRCDDRPENLELIDAATHNKHHKTGTKHKKESKDQISSTIRRMYEEGKMKPTRDGLHFLGKHHTPETKEKLRKAQLKFQENKRKLIRENNSD